MKRIKIAGLAAMLVWLPALAFAQLPGEPKAPPAYDPTGDAQYRFKLGSPDERVRDAQRVLQDKGYYRGPVDGLMTPEMRRAVWNFQKAEGFRLSGRLDPQTMAALGLGSPGAPPRDDTASSPETQPSASPGDRGGARSAPGPRDFQAP
jgi:peptidoglycan hydrolase-like protein with peptidoglycan-binding domain